MTLHMFLAMLACGFTWRTVHKSGGTLLNKERGRGHDLTQAQTYIAFAGPYANGSHVNLFSVSYFLADWAHQLPYSDGGGAIFDSQPIHAVVEFFSPRLIVSSGRIRSKVSSQTYLRARPLGLPFECWTLTQTRSGLTAYATCSDRMHRSVRTSCRTTIQSFFGHLTCGPEKFSSAQTIVPMAPSWKASHGPASRPACRNS